MTNSTEIEVGENYVYVGEFTDGEPTWCDVQQTSHNPDRRSAQFKVQLDIVTDHDFGRPKLLRPIWVYSDELEPLNQHPNLV